MGYKKVFQESYNEYIDSELMCLGENERWIEEFNKQSDFDKKCGWISNTLFSITTYDGVLDVEFGKYIYLVMKSILNRTTFDFIKKSDHNYKTFIIVCNILESHNLLNWGCSIRGCWFDFYNENDLDLTEESIKYLLEKFINENK